MSDELERLEYEAVRLIETNHLTYVRRTAIGGLAVDLLVRGVDAKFGLSSLALQLQRSSPTPSSASFSYSEREAEHLEGSGDSLHARILVPGDVQVRNPLVTLQELGQLFSTWTPAAADRVATKPFKPQTRQIPVFCAMPFREDFLDVFFLGILPATQAARLTVDRLDQTASLTAITKRIRDGISRAEIVIADISGHNANVMYEIGLAHGLGVQALVLRDNATEVPFDIKDHLAITYNRNRLHVMGDALARTLIQLFPI